MDTVRVYQQKQKKQSTSDMVFHITVVVLVIIIFGLVINLLYVINKPDKPDKKMEVPDSKPNSPPVSQV